MRLVILYIPIDILSLLSYIFIIENIVTFVQYWFEKLAGAEGIEPPKKNATVKVSCLTAWLYPNNFLCWLY